MKKILLIIITAVLLIIFAACSEINDSTEHILSGYYVPKDGIFALDNATLVSGFSFEGNSLTLGDSVWTGEYSIKSGVMAFGAYSFDFEKDGASFFLNGVEFVKSEMPLDMNPPSLIDDGSITGTWTIEEDEYLAVLQFYKNFFSYYETGDGFYTGTYTLTDTEIEIVYSAGWSDVLSFSRSGDMITVDGEIYRRTSHTTLMNDLPPPSAEFHIADFAGVLEANSPEHGDNILEWIIDIHKDGFNEIIPGTQLVVATIPSLGGVNAEYYANLLLLAWDVGTAPREDRGMLLLLAPADNQAAFVVESGLKVMLPDETINEFFNTPPFDGGSKTFWDYFNEANFTDAVCTFVDHLEDNWLYSLEAWGYVESRAPVAWDSPLISYEVMYEAESAHSTHDMNIVRDMIRYRLNLLNAAEIDADINNHQITARFSTPLDPEEVIVMVGRQAVLEFRDADEKVLITNGDIESAEAVYGDIGNGYNEYYINLKFKPEAVLKFAEATRTAAARSGEYDSATGRHKNYIAIYLDDILITAPSVQHEINSDSCVITGGYDKMTAEYMAAIISAGQLPFALKNIQLIILE